MCKNEIFDWKKNALLSGKESMYGGRDVILLKKRSRFGGAEPTTACAQVGRHTTELTPLLELEEQLQ